MTISLRSHDEFLAAIPHMFGFKPEESIVIYPLNPGLPRIRASASTFRHQRRHAKTPGTPSRSPSPWVPGLTPSWRSSA